MKNLEEKDIEILLEMCEATVKKSVPSMKEEDIETFLSQNFWELYPVVLNLNLNRKK